VESGHLGIREFFGGGIWDSGWLGRPSREATPSISAAVRWRVGGSALGRLKLGEHRPSLAGVSADSNPTTNSLQTGSGAVLPLTRAFEAKDNMTSGRSVTMGRSVAANPALPIVWGEAVA